MLITRLQNNNYNLSWLDVKFMALNVMRYSLLFEMDFSIMTLK